METFKILIVEDNLHFRQSLREILQSKFPSMIIDEAENGNDALQNISLDPPHLIFMDIKLQGENGLSLTKQIKNDHPGITIIVITNYNIPEYKEAAHKSGASYFLTKSSSSGREITDLVGSLLIAANNNGHQ